MRATVGAMAAAWGLAGSLLAGSPRQAAADGLARCERLLAADVTGRAAGQCFYQEGARAPGAAEQRLTRAATANADAPWLAYFRAELVARRSPRAAVPIHRAAVEAFARRADEVGEARGRIRLSATLFKAGDAAGARAEEGDALRVADATSNTDVKARARLHLVWLALQSQERLAMAGRALQETQALVFPRGPTELQYLTLSGLGNVAFQLGRAEDALAHFAAAADLAGVRAMSSTRRWRASTS